MKRIISIFVLSVFVLSIALANIPTPLIYKNNYIEIYDKDNNLINSQIENKHGNYIFLNTIQDHTINAFIAYEDKNFYKHKGFDIPRMIKSFFTNLFSFSFSQGASTITQQYARTIFLSNKKSLTRKIKEAYYTTKLEKKYTKNQILEGYLNNIYLGHGCYGIDAASKYYFNKSAKELTLDESATLASLPSSPSSSSPYINYQKSKSRRNDVLKAMLNQGYISQELYKENIKKDTYINNDNKYETNINYYFDQAKKVLSTYNIPLNKGIKIYTNIDANLYKIITPLVKKYKNSTTQLSLMILENNSNKILFDIGGFDYQTSSYNRSIDAKRQVGSTIKTFLYSLALENNFSLSTTLTSKPTTFDVKNYGIYSPSNSNNIYANKKITMKEAFAVSDNIYAVKTLLLLGGDNFNAYLKKFNLNTNDTNPSMALGTSEFTLFELLKAYSTYANEGYYYNYSFVNKITDSFDNLLYKNPTVKKQVINKSVVDKVKTLMSLPFYNNNYYTKSTLEKYKISGYYGKSGSTSSDSYLILINDKYTIGCWIGSENNEKIYDYTTSKYLLKDITDLI